MIYIAHGASLADPLHAAMFADRKVVFVDLLGWDIPVIDGRFEIDQFDHREAIYLIAVDDAGNHEGSLRLLPTERPHILGDLFADLCDGGAPRGPAVFEITRLCVPPRLSRDRRRTVRDRLISALVDHAMTSAIVTLTAVVAWNFLEQVRAMGWRCRALGGGRSVAGARLGAFRIDLDADTPVRLTETGIYSPQVYAAQLARAAA